MKNLTYTLKKTFSFTKITSIFTTICFVISIICSQTIYAAMPLANTLPLQNSLNTLSDTIIPFNLGRITDAYYANSGDIVISIQDLHCHEQTQRNIS